MSRKSVMRGTMVVGFSRRDMTMVITKADDYSHMIYTGNIKTKGNSMWLDIAKEFARTDMSNPLGTLYSVSRDDEEGLCLWFHGDDGNNNHIDITYDSMCRLAAGEIIVVYVW